MYVSDWNAKYAGNNHWEYWDKYSEIFPNQRQNLPGLEQITFSKRLKLRAVIEELKNAD